MLHELFLRDDGDPSGDPKDPKDPKDPELGKQDPKADPQGGKADPEPKPGLSAEEKAKFDVLEKEKGDLEKRLSDTQAEFHENRKELKNLRTKVDDFSKPPIKPEEQFADDSEIQGINREIEAYKANDYDLAPLNRAKSLRIEVLQMRKELADIKARNRESDAIGSFLVENPDATDLTAAGKAKDELTKRGEKVSVDTAYHYDLGKKRKEDFESAVKKEVEKRLEADDKGKGARGQEGEFTEPPPEDKEMEEYADQLNNPGGLDLEGF